MDITITGGAAYTLAGVATDGVETITIRNFDTDNTANGTQIDAALISGASTVSLAASGADGDTYKRARQHR